MDSQEERWQQETLEDTLSWLETERQRYQKQLRRWNRWKILPVSLVSVCETGGMLVFNAENKAGGIVLMLTGLFIMLTAPVVLVKYQPSLGRTHALSLRNRLGELYLEIFLWSIAGSGILSILAVLASLGLEYLDSIINRGP